MTSAERKLLLPFLRDVAKVPHVVLASTAERLLQRFGKARRPMPPRKVEKKEKRLAKNEETRAIRAAVFKRADGLCELCTHEWCGEPTELHHLEGGTGRRLQMQAVSNCVAVCRKCHRDYHSDPKRFAARVAIWCAKYGFPIPSRFRRAA